MNSSPPIVPAIGRDDRQRGALAVRVGERAGDEAAEEAAHQEDEHRDERERLRAHAVRRDRADDRADAHERGAVHALASATNRSAATIGSASASRRP